MKILVITKNWIGDVLFQTPAIETLKARWPEAEIVCLSPPRCRPVLERNPAVSRVVEFDERGTHKSLAARLKVISALRREKWDRAYLFHRSRSRAFMAWLAGAGSRTGYGKRRSWLLTEAVREPVEPMHHVDYFLFMLKQAGFTVKEPAAYRFYILPGEESEAESLLSQNGLGRQGFVCFHLGANWEPKRWPVERFAETAELIHERWGLPVVLTGSEADAVLASAFRPLVRKARCVSLIGGTSLGVLASVFSKAAFIVSADSGPMHIASGAGARVVALFGPTSPALTGPRGQGKSVVLHFVPEGFQAPWYGDHFPEGGWMSRILPEQVVEAVEKAGWMRKKPAEEETHAH